MKTTERRHLKENELAHVIDQGLGVLGTNRRSALAIFAILVIVGGALGGYFYWRSSTNANAETLLGEAMTVMESPVTQPPPPPAAGQPATPPPVPQPGAYATEQAKLEAALNKF